MSPARASASSGVSASLIPPALPRPPVEHLRLDDDRAAELLGRGARLLRRGRQPAVRHGDAGAPEELLALVLVEVQAAGEPSGRALRTAGPTGARRSRSRRGARLQPRIELERARDVPERRLGVARQRLEAREVVEQHASSPCASRAARRIAAPSAYCPGAWNASPDAARPRRVDLEQPPELGDRRRVILDPSSQTRSIPSRDSDAAPTRSTTIAADCCPRESPPAAWPASSAEHQPLRERAAASRGTPAPSRPPPPRRRGCSLGRRSRPRPVARPGKALGAGVGRRVPSAATAPSCRDCARHRRRAHDPAPPPVASPPSRSASTCGRTPRLRPPASRPRRPLPSPTARPSRPRSTSTGRRSPPRSRPR